MQVIKIEEGGSVLIKDGDIESWVDVWVRDGELCCGWNKYIFYLDDEEQQVWQDNPDNFDIATSLAIEALEKEKQIYQDTTGKWYSKN